jgi:hypothetical protein
MATRAAASIQANGFPAGDPASITVVSDQPLPFTAGIRFVPVPRPAGSFGCLQYKTRFLDYAQAHEVLYLDCDTLVTGDISPVFASAGVAMSLSAFPQAWLDAPDRAATVDAGVDLSPAARWTTGVIAISNDAAGHALLAAWHAEWRKHRHWDELAMLRALKSQGVTPATLASSYNDQAWPPKTGVIQHWVSTQKHLNLFRKGL